MTHQEEDWADVGPADAPEDPWRVTDHLLDVMRETIHSIEPAHPCRFHKHHEEDGDSRTVDVEQVHQVHPALEQALSVIIFCQVVCLLDVRSDQQTYP